MMVIAGLAALFYSVYSLVQLFIRPAILAHAYEPAMWISLIVGVGLLSGAYRTRKIQRANNTNATSPLEEIKEKSGEGRDKEQAKETAQTI